jgi:hypothetical protein
VVLVLMLGKAPADAFVVPDTLKIAVSTATGAVPPAQDAPALKSVPELFHVMLAPSATVDAATKATATRASPRIDGTRTWEHIRIVFAPRPHWRENRTPENPLTTAKVVSLRPDPTTSYERA